MSFFNGSGSDNTAAEAADEVDEFASFEGSNTGSTGRASLPRNLVQPRVESHQDVMNQIIHEADEVGSGSDGGGDVDYHGTAKRYNTAPAVIMNVDASNHEDASFVPGARLSQHQSSNTLPMTSIISGMDDIVNLTREPVHNADEVPKEHELQAAVLSGRSDLARWVGKKVVCAHATLNCVVNSASLLVQLSHKTNARVEPL